MGWSISACKYWNQLVFKLQDISTLEVRILKVWHMGFSNILTLVFYL
jgi:hypothetical protein